MHNDCQLRLRDSFADWVDGKKTLLFRSAVRRRVQDADSVHLS